ncbi:FAD-dependent oxidoreductase [Streptomyces gamaensis]|uniref:FAD-dependent oxidoreductase n=1 Tax=Streptomyces gamaensis TaxID=1763542 RepID=A0ABW0Z642_9ACTN
MTTAGVGRLLVVGYGPAAHRLVDRLCAYGHDGPVTVLGAEPHPAYQRPLLTSLLDGALSPAALTLPPPPAPVTVRLGCAVTALDRRRRVVRTADGAELPYDTLVLATGARPALPSLPGLPEGAGALRTLDDCARLPDGPAAVVGAGVLGVETAFALRRAGRDVDLVHRGPWPMRHLLGERPGLLLARLLRDAGVRLRPGTEAERFHPGSGKLALRDGQLVRADAVLLCTGVTAATGPARRAGLAVGSRGFLVDDALRTSDPRIHAIGDCAQHPAGAPGHLTTAWDQAEALARLLATGRGAYRGTREVVRPRIPGVDLVALPASGAGSGADTTAARQRLTRRDRGAGTAPGPQAPAASPDESGPGPDALPVVHEPRRERGTCATPLPHMPLPSPVEADELLSVHDAGRGRSAELVLRDGALAAATVVGFPHAVAALTQLRDSGDPLPADALSLLLGTGPAPGGLADDAVVCQCNNVTRAALLAAWRAGARSLPELVAATRATTGCGTCAALVETVHAEAAAQGERSGGNGTVAHSLSPAAGHGPVAAGPGRRHPVGPGRVGASRTLLVVGHGMAGHRLVTDLRARDLAGDWHVVVLAEEGRPAYDRLALSAYAAGRTDRQLTLTGHHFLTDPRIDLRLATAAASVDRAARRVVTACGARLCYDALVFATGSRPFVPPVPGHGLPGTFVWRTVDDADAIRANAVPGGPAVVIGGGLLGLEAADALRRLGMRVEVLEAAPWPMAAQLDEDGGAVLARRVRALGIGVRCGVTVAEVVAGPDGRVAAVRTADGGAVPAGLVVYAAGVRPRDELAASAGLETGGRGGFLVDDRCRTADPRIWAVGECAAVEGRCYGLVAPGYRMAEAVVDQLLGVADTAFTGADTSAVLRLPGAEAASFGEASATAPGAIECVRADRRADSYARLVLGADGGTLLGGVLAGDAGAYPLLRPLVGRPLPAAARRAWRAAARDQEPVTKPKE